MSWSLSVSGHLASPEEEQEISTKIVEFVEELAKDPRHVVSGASFQGQYGSWSKNQTDLEPLAEKGES